MAFRFFRRRQKLVVIIMAVLMVSFLIGLQGFSALFSKSGRDRPYAQTSYGELTVGEVDSARTDIEILTRYVGIGDFRHPMGLEFLELLQNRERLRLTYALLLKEAENMGVLVSEADVDEVLGVFGLEGDRYDRVVAELREGMDLAGKHLRAAVANWLKIHRAYITSRVDTPPSQDYLKQLYADLNEEINLRVAEIPASEFTEQVEEPTDDQIREHFEKYRDVLPADKSRTAYSEENPFGFGYRYPDRVKIAYLMIENSVLRRVTRPSDERIREYYADHESEFYREVPRTRPSTQSAATAPATSTAPAEERKKKVRIPLDPSNEVNAWDDIVKKLTPALVENRINRLIGQIDTMLNEYPSAKEEGDAYRWVMSRLEEPADTILKTPLSGDDISSQGLDKASELKKAVEKLARLSGLEGICYPWGTGGEISVKPDVKVTLEAKDMTLAQALESITEQAFAVDESATRPAATAPATQPVGPPNLQWVRCRGISNVLFCRSQNENLDMFPVKYGRSDLLSQSEILSNRILGAAYIKPSGGENLGQIAFSSKPFTEEGEDRGSVLDVGVDGPRMYVLGMNPGRLFWRIVRAEPSSPPKELTDEIREQVVKDLKTEAAMKLAEKKAVELLKDLSPENADLAELAGEKELETWETGKFSRKRMYSPIGGTYVMLRRYAGLSEQQAMMQSALQKPWDFNWNSVEKLNLPTDRIAETFMSEAFALAPEDIEPPYPETSNEVEKISMPSQRSVVLIQRIGYNPPVISEYRQTGRDQLASVLTRNMHWEARKAWFSFDKVSLRLDYRPVEE